MSAAVPWMGAFTAMRSAAALLGSEPQHLAGKPLAVFIPEEGRPAFRSELHRLKTLDSSLFTDSKAGRVKFRNDPRTETHPASPDNSHCTAGEAPARRTAPRLPPIRPHSFTYLSITSVMQTRNNLFS